MDLYESLDGGPASMPNIIEAPIQQLDDPLAAHEKIPKLLDVIRDRSANLLHISRAFFFIEESQAVDSSELKKLANIDSLSGAVLFFSQPGLVAVAVEGSYDAVDRFFRNLLRVTPSARLVYFTELFPNRGFFGFSIHRQSAVSSGVAVAENSSSAELAGVTAKVLKALMDVSAVGERVSEEATNGLFPRNELIKVLIRSEVAMNLEDWNSLFAEDAPIYTGDSDKLWPPLRV